MIYLYDIALKQYFKHVFDNTFLVERTQLFKVLSDAREHNENIKLPVISLWRTENSLTLDAGGRNYMEKSYGSVVIVKDKDGNVVKERIKGYRINLVYTIDIVAGDYVSLDEMLCDTLFYLNNNPNVSFKLSDEIQLDLTFNIDVEDLSINTDFSSFSEIGKYYNQQLIVSIKDARIIHLKDTNLVTSAYVSLYAPELNDPDKLLDYIDVRVS